MRPVVKVHVVDALVDYPWSVEDEEDCNDAKQNLRCLRISAVEASTHGGERACDALAARFLSDL